MTEVAHGGIMPPDKILKQIDIRDNMQIADFGCGSGYFTLPMAKAANNGTVYAFDVIKDALEAVKSKAQMEKIENIVTVHADLERPRGTQLDSGTIDMVLMRNILFQSQKKQDILAEAFRVLGTGSALVIIEWIPGSTLAPKEGWLVDKNEATKLAESAGFSFDNELDLDNQHYGLVFNK